MIVSVLICVTVLIAKLEGAELNDESSNGPMSGNEFPHRYKMIMGVNDIVPVMKKKFSCKGREYGYYADMDNNCQVYHVCNPIHDMTGQVVMMQHYSFVCGMKTVFNQQTMTCTDPFMAPPCKSAESYYSINDKFVKFEKQPTGRRAGSRRGDGEIKRVSDGRKYRLEDIETTTTTEPGLSADDVDQIREFLDNITTDEQVRDIVVKFIDDVFYIIVKSGGNPQQMKVDLVVLVNRCVENVHRYYDVEERRPRPDQELEDTIIEFVKDVVAPGTTEKRRNDLINKIMTFIEYLINRIESAGPGKRSMEEWINALVDDLVKIGRSDDTDRNDLIVIRAHQFVKDVYEFHGRNDTDGNVELQKLIVSFTEDIGKSLDDPRDVLRQRVREFVDELLNIQTAVPKNVDELALQFVSEIIRNTTELPQIGDDFIIRVHLFVQDVYSTNGTEDSVKPEKLRFLINAFVKDIEEVVSDATDDRVETQNNLMAIVLRFVDYLLSSGTKNLDGITKDFVNRLMDVGKEMREGSPKTTEVDMVVITYRFVEDVFKFNDEIVDKKKDEIIDSIKTFVNESLQMVTDTSKDNHDRLTNLTRRFVRTLNDIGIDEEEQRLKKQLVQDVIRMIKEVIDDETPGALDLSVTVNKFIESLLKMNNVTRLGGNDLRKIERVAYDFVSDTAEITKRIDKGSDDEVYKDLLDRVVRFSRDLLRSTRKGDLEISDGFEDYVVSFVEKTENESRPILDDRIGRIVNVVVSTNEFINDLMEFLRDSDGDAKTKVLEFTRRKDVPGDRSERFSVVFNAVADTVEGVVNLPTEKDEIPRVNLIIEFVKKVIQEDDKSLAEISKKFLNALLRIADVGDDLRKDFETNSETFVTDVAKIIDRNDNENETADRLADRTRNFIKELGEVGVIEEIPAVAVITVVEDVADLKGMEPTRRNAILQAFKLKILEGEKDPATFEGRIPEAEDNFNTTADDDKESKFNVIIVDLIKDLANFSTGINGTDDALLNNFIQNVDSDNTTDIGRMKDELKKAIEKFVNDLDVFNGTDSYSDIVRNFVEDLANITNIDDDHVDSIVTDVVEAFVNETQPESHVETVDDRGIVHDLGNVTDIVQDTVNPSGNESTNEISDHVNRLVDDLTNITNVDEDDKNDLKRIITDFVQDIRDVSDDEDATIEELGGRVHNFIVDVNNVTLIRNIPEVETEILDFVRDVLANKSDEVSKDAEYLEGRVEDFAQDLSYLTDVRNGNLSEIILNFVRNVVNASSDDEPSEISPEQKIQVDKFVEELLNITDLQVHSDDALKAVIVDFVKDLSNMTVDVGKLSGIDDVIIAAIEDVSNATEVTTPAGVLETEIRDPVADRVRQFVKGLAGVTNVADLDVNSKIQLARTIVTFTDQIIGTLAKNGSDAPTVSKHTKKFIDDLIKLTNVSSNVKDMVLEFVKDVTNITVDFTSHLDNVTSSQLDGRVDDFVEKVKGFTDVDKTNTSELGDVIKDFIKDVSGTHGNDSFVGSVQDFVSKLSNITEIDDDVKLHLPAVIDNFIKSISDPAENLTDDTLKERFDERIEVFIDDLNKIPNFEVESEEALKDIAIELVNDLSNLPQDLPRIPSDRVEEFITDLSNETDYNRTSEPTFNKTRNPLSDRIQRFVQDLADVTNIADLDERSRRLLAYQIVSFANNVRGTVDLEDTARPPHLKEYTADFVENLANIVGGKDQAEKFKAIIKDFVKDVTNVTVDIAEPLVLYSSGPLVKRVEDFVEYLKNATEIDDKTNDVIVNFVKDLSNYTVGLNGSDQDVAKFIEKFVERFSNVTEIDGNQRNRLIFNLIRKTPDESPTGKSKLDDRQIEVIRKLHSELENVTDLDDDTKENLKDIIKDLVIEISNKTDHSRETLAERIKEKIAQFFDEMANGTNVTSTIRDDNETSFNLEKPIKVFVKALGNITDIDEKLKYKITDVILDFIDDSGERNTSDDSEYQNERDRLGDLLRQVSNVTDADKDLLQFTKDLVLEFFDDLKNLTSTEPSETSGVNTVLRVYKFADDIKSSYNISTVDEKKLENIVFPFVNKVVHALRGDEDEILAVIKNFIVDLVTRGQDHDEETLINDFMNNLINDAVDSGHSDFEIQSRVNELITGLHNISGNVSVDSETATSKFIGDVSDLISTADSYYTDEIKEALKVLVTEFVQEIQNKTESSRNVYEDSIPEFVADLFAIKSKYVDKPDTMEIVYVARVMRLIRELIAGANAGSNDDIQILVGRLNEFGYYMTSESNESGVELTKESSNEIKYAFNGLIQSVFDMPVLSVDNIDSIREKIADFVIHLNAYFHPNDNQLDSKASSPLLKEFIDDLALEVGITDDLKTDLEDFVRQFVDDISSFSDSFGTASKQMSDFVNLRSDVLLDDLDYIGDIAEISKDKVKDVIRRFLEKYLQSETKSPDEIGVSKTRLRDGIENFVGDLFRAVDIEERHEGRFKNLTENFIADVSDLMATLNEDSKNNNTDLVDRVSAYVDDIGNVTKINGSSGNELRDTIVDLIEDVKFENNSPDGLVARVKEFVTKLSDIGTIDANSTDYLSDVIVNFIANIQNDSDTLTPGQFQHVNSFVSNLTKVVDVNPGSEDVLDNLVVDFVKDISAIDEDITDESIETLENVLLHVFDALNVTEVTEPTTVTDKSADERNDTLAERIKKFVKQLSDITNIADKDFYTKQKIVSNILAFVKDVLSTADRSDADSKTVRIVLQVDDFVGKLRDITGILGEPVDKLKKIIVDFVEDISDVTFEFDNKSSEELKNQSNDFMSKLNDVLELQSETKDRLSEVIAEFLTDVASNGYKNLTDRVEAFSDALVNITNADNGDLLREIVSDFVYGIAEPITKPFDKNITNTVEDPSDFRYTAEDGSLVDNTTDYFTGTSGIYSNDTLDVSKDETILRSSQNDSTNEITKIFPSLSKVDQFVDDLVNQEIISEQSKDSLKAAFSNLHGHLSNLTVEFKTGSLEDEQDLSDAVADFVDELVAVTDVSDEYADKLKTIVEDFIYDAITTARRGSQKQNFIEDLIPRVEDFIVNLSNLSYIQANETGNLRNSIFNLFDSDLKEESDAEDQLKARVKEIFYNFSNDTEESLTPRLINLIRNVSLTEDVGETFNQTLVNEIIKFVHDLIINKTSGNPEDEFQTDIQSNLEDNIINFIRNLKPYYNVDDDGESPTEPKDDTKQHRVIVEFFKFLNRSKFREDLLPEEDKTELNENLDKLTDHWTNLTSSHLLRGIESYNQESGANETDEFVEYFGEHAENVTISEDLIDKVVELVSHLTNSTSEELISRIEDFIWNLSKTRLRKRADLVLDFVKSLNVTLTDRQEDNVVSFIQYVMNITSPVLINHIRGHVKNVIGSKSENITDIFTDFIKKLTQEEYGNVVEGIKRYAEEHNITDVDFLKDQALRYIANTSDDAVNSRLRKFLKDIRYKLSDDLTDQIKTFVNDLNAANTSIDLRKEIEDFAIYLNVTADNEMLDQFLKLVNNVTSENMLPKLKVFVNNLASSEYLETGIAKFLSGLKTSQHRKMRSTDWLKLLKVCRIPLNRYHC
ncbi:Uncharacterised protein g590 [Pycnogonum litorale]